MNKSELRALYRQKRAELSEREIDRLSLQIAHFLHVLIPEKAEFVHVFLPIRKFHEINTYLIKDFLTTRHPQVSWVISRTNFESGQMHHQIWNNHTVIIESAMGIPEPEPGEELAIERIDVVLIPLLTFDSIGHRIGYGKGFYDRFLAQCRKDCLTIGLSLFPPTEHPIPFDSWDMALQFCVSPYKTYRF